MTAGGQLGWKSAFLRPKGNIEPGHLAVLVAVATLPLVMVVLRVSALPGAVSLGFDFGLIRSIGSALNESLSLSSVPPVQRDRVLYLLTLPLSAMLIAIARLTLGIRVLGFRSILISIGFRESGFLPGLLLIGLVTATIVAVRPRMRQLKLPRYARISVVLSIVVIMMVGALLLAPILRSDAVWELAFFPVIVLGLLAEGIARSLDEDNLFTATWRGATTVVLAFMIAIVCESPLARSTMLEFPELVLTQVVTIVLISEYLDLRLLEDWDAKLAGMAPPRLFSNPSAYRVAVVRNREHTGVISRCEGIGPRRASRRSVQTHVDALRDAGHTVRVLEGDMSLLRELRDFVPPHPRTGEPGGLVLNLADGIQGIARPAHVPAMLELAGVAYTGPTPWGHVLAVDQLVSKELLRQAGVPVPGVAAIEDGEPPGLAFPLVVKPRHEASYPLIIVGDRRELGHAVEKVARRFRQPVVVEEFVAGRRVSVGVLGNDPPECLPLVEVDDATGKRRCPAAIDEALAARLRRYAVAAFRACGCRDVARIDFRVPEGGDARLIEVSSVGILGRSSVVALAARRAGLEFDALVCRVVEIARSRYVRAASPDRPARRRGGSASG